MRQFLFCLLGIMLLIPTACQSTHDETYNNLQLYIEGCKAVFDHRDGYWLCCIPRERFHANDTLNVSFSSDNQTIIVDNKIIQNHGYLVLTDIDSHHSYTVNAKINGKQISAPLKFTCLPIVEISGHTSKQSTMASVTIIDPYEMKGNTKSLKAKIKWRGTLAASQAYQHHKRNYRIKFVDHDNNKSNQQLFGLRKDNTWILDGGRYDMLRVRNHIAQDLWLDMSRKPYYATNEPKTVNGSRGKLVEIFVNGQYEGLYNMCEPIDRKQLRLKRYDEQTNIFRGALWKVVTMNRNTSMLVITQPDENQSTWDGFEVKYPRFDNVHPTNYEPLAEAARFVAQTDQDSSAFARRVGEYFDIPVLIDYYIFMQVTMAIDNDGKNLYWSCYDCQRQQRLTLTPWDLDATMGQDYSQLANRTDLISPNRNFDTRMVVLHNLMELPSIKSQVTERYWQLRRSVLDTDSLISRYQQVINIIYDSGAGEREQQLWSGDSDIAGQELNFETELQRITHWIALRLNYLDKTLFCP